MSSISGREVLPLVRGFVEAIARFPLSIF